MKLQLHNATDIPVPEEQLRLAVETVLAGEQFIADAQVSLILVTDDELRTMKQTYFQVNQYTDVIAFNLNEKGEALEGELYLAPGQIRQNAAAYRQDFRTEFLRVAIHGVLHLCGHEDDTPERKADMHQREDHYLRAMGIGLDA